MNQVEITICGFAPQGRVVPQLRGKSQGTDSSLLLWPRAEFGPRQMFRNAPGMPSLSLRTCRVQPTSTAGRRAVPGDAPRWSRHGCRPLVCAQMVHCGPARSLSGAWRRLHGAGLAGSPRAHLLTSNNARIIALRQRFALLCSPAVTFLESSRDVRQTLCSVTGEHWLHRQESQARQSLSRLLVWPLRRVAHQSYVPFSASSSSV